MADPRAIIDPPSSDCETSPLDFLFGEHLRQRQLAKALHLAADGVINRKTIARLVSFIRNDLALHVMDEELSFFPALRAACEPEDKVEEILEIMATEHQECEADSDEIIATLESMAAARKLDNRRSDRLREFADRLRHHLALENGVLLPIARLRMNADALRSVGESMSARRAARRH